MPTEPDLVIEEIKETIARIKEHLDKIEAYVSELEKEEPK